MDRSYLFRNLLATVLKFPPVTKKPMAFFTGENFSVLWPDLCLCGPLFDWKSPVFQPGFYLNWSRCGVLLSKVFARLGKTFYELISGFWSLTEILLQLVKLRPLPHYYMNLPIGQIQSHLTLIWSHGQVSHLRPASFPPVVGWDHAPLVIFALVPWDWVRDGQVLSCQHWSSLG